MFVWRLPGGGKNAPSRVKPNPSQKHGLEHVESIYEISSAKSKRNFRNTKKLLNTLGEDASDLNTPGQAYPGPGEGLLGCPSSSYSHTCSHVVLGSPSSLSFLHAYRECCLFGLGGAI